MAAFLPEHKVERHSEHLNVMDLWQTLRLAPAHIDSQCHSRFVNERGAQDAQTPRLDQAGKRGRAAGDQSLALTLKLRPVVGHQPRAQPDHLERKRRLAGTRRPEDQQRPPVQRDAAGMEDRAALPAHSGRPTTKRAPSGSEVMSALVGRMFSAQITPPCDSTICLEMASPSPE